LKSPVFAQQLKMKLLTATLTVRAVTTITEPNSLITKKPHLRFFYFTGDVINT
jgi:hypothetical protein